jgi:quercetin dioxygenase-like cupin family protein
MKIVDEVERLRFDPNVAYSPAEPLLDRVTLAPLTAPLRTGVPVQAAVFRIAPGGRIGRHPATVPQLLAVFGGSGEVAGADGEFQPIAAGEAVFWAAGEEHETRSEEGLTALVIEGAGLEPLRR